MFMNATLLHPGPPHVSEGMPSVVGIAVVAGSVVGVMVVAGSVVGVMVVAGSVVGVMVVPGSVVGVIVVAGSVVDRSVVSEMVVGFVGSVSGSWLSTSVHSYNIQLRLAFSFND